MAKISLALEETSAEFDYVRSFCNFSRLKESIFIFCAVLSITLISAPKTSAAQVSPYYVPTANSTRSGIITGPNGNLCFTEDGGKIGRITTSWVITEFAVPTSLSSYSYTYSIAACPDVDFILALINVEIL